MIALTVSFLVFWSYVLYIWWHYGVHTSISASYYSLKNNQKWMFTMWCWGFAVPLTIMAMLNGGGGITFFSGAFIAGVGAAPRNWDGANQFLQKTFGLRKGEKVVHKWAAYLGVLMIQIALIIEFPGVLPKLFAALFVVSSLILLKTSKNAIWWIEVIAFNLFWIKICLILAG